MLIYRFGGRQREMGLGALADVTLARAREKAAAARASLADGVDPLATQEEPRRVPTFKEFSEEIMGSLLPGFSNEKHRNQWTMTLRTYAAPLHAKRLDEIVTQDVLDVLKPIWIKIPETADRTRQRIERILDAAEAAGWRPNGLRNPASWKGNLKHLLPARRASGTKHHAAIPYESLPAFVAALRQRQRWSAWALEFTILTAARSGEVLKATWPEIDFERRIWTVPAGRMKAKKEHRVALSDRAIELLSELQPASGEGIVFALGRHGKGLSNMAMTMLMRDMTAHYITTPDGRRPATVHGFRSSFRDWAGSATDFPRELAEEALAHTVGNAVERAYRRGDALEKRRVMMSAWETFLSGKQEEAERDAA